MNKIILETNRVILKETTPNDSHLLQELDSDAEVMKYLTGGRTSTDEEHLATMSRIQTLKEKHQDKFGVWLAYEKESQEFMGWFLFRPDKKTPEDVMNIELGYRLKKKFWGKGFATEVSKDLISRGFRLYKLDSIFAVTLMANLGSQAVMKKVGMNWVCNYTEDQFPGEDKLAVRYELKLNEWKLMHST